jgi:hypothetical protein
MWKDKISRWTDIVDFNGPAAPTALQECERALGQLLPRGLAELLLECDGVVGEYGLGLVWPIERIMSDNLAFRTNPDFASLYMPFDPLLFFADAGNGDQFAFVVRDRPTCSSGITKRTAARGSPQAWTRIWNGG